MGAPYLIFFMSQAKGSSILFIFSKNQLLVLLSFLFFLNLYFTYLCSDLYDFFSSTKFVLLCVCVVFFFCLFLFFVFSLVALGVSLGCLFEIFLVCWGKLVSLYTSLLEMLLLHSIDFGLLWFSFHLSFKYFWFLQWSIGCLVAYCFVSTCLCCLWVFPGSWVLASWHCGQKICLIFNFLQFIEACFVTQHVISRGGCSECTWKECVFCCFWVEFLIKSISPNMSFKAYVSLLIFYLDDLSIDVSRVLKFPTISMLLLISSVIAISVCLICWSAIVLVGSVYAVISHCLRPIPWSLCSVLLCLL